MTVGTGFRSSPIAPPNGPPANALSTLDGPDANGVWSLFLHDDNGGETGQVAGGWGITFVEERITPIPLPGALPLALGALGALGLVARRRAQART